MMTEEQKKYGKIDLFSYGCTFHWVLSGGERPELFGHIQKADGSVMKGSSGWYRTADPQEAAAFAETILLDYQSSAKA